MESRAPFLIEMDPPEHGIYRRMLAGEFSVRRINHLRPRIQEVADERIDALLGGGPPADLVAGFALPVPSMMICHLLGVPYADHEFFESRTRAATASSDGNREAASAAIEEVSAYLDRLVSEKERHPTDDLIGRLIQEHVRTGALGHEQLVGLAVLLLLAGHETTASTIALGVVMLLEHPDQLAAFRDDPALAAGAVEEMVRLQSIGDAGAARAVVADIEVGGRLIRAGEGILPLIPAANRDPEAIDRPDVFDIRRGDRHHLGFGFGIHRCLGENLARATVEIALRTLFERIPTLRLDAPLEELPFKIRGGDIRPALAPGRVVGPVGPAWRVGGSRRRWIHAVDAYNTGMNDPTIAPARPGLRKRKKEQTRKVIAETARAFFRERGFDGVTVAEIADASNVSVKTLFTYFGIQGRSGLRGRERAAGPAHRPVRDRSPGQSAFDAVAGFLTDLVLAAGRRPVLESLERFRRSVDSPAVQSRLRLMWERYEEALAALLASETGAPAHDPRTGSSPPS